MQENRTGAETHYEDASGAPSELYCRRLDDMAHEVVESAVKCMVGDREARGRVFRDLRLAYMAIFAVGLVAFAATLWKGLMADTAGEAYATAAFAGLSAASFLTLVVFRPLESLARNSIFLSWLNISTTSYWTRHYYLNKRLSLDRDLENATHDTLQHLHALLDEHARVSAERPSRFRRRSARRKPAAAVRPLDTAA